MQNHKATTFPSRATTSPLRQVCNRTLEMTKDTASLEFISQIGEHRLAGIFQGIQEWGNRPIEFSRDPQGTHLYSIEETKRAYCRRFIKLALAARTLLEDDQTIAACIVARAQIETVAMATFFIHEVSRLIRTGDIDKFNTKIERFIVGASSEGAMRNRIHVADALRHLQILDEAYINHLWIRHPTMIELYSAILTPQEKSVEAKDVVASVSATRNYNFLCEFAHPNGLGTFFIFGQPENEGNEQAAVHSRLIRHTKSATWQGHHMLESLNASVDPIKRIL